MREHTYPGSYESHLRRRVKKLEEELRNIERQNYVYRLMDDRLKELEAENEQLRQKLVEQDSLIDSMTWQGYSPTA